MAVAPGLVRDIHEYRWHHGAPVDVYLGFQLTHDPSPYVETS